MASVIHYTIATEAEKSPDFRRVLWTGEHTQLVIMTIPKGGEIGEEVHEVDQILTFVSGTGKAKVGGQEKKDTPPEAIDPALALPRQKLEQLRNQDSPAQLFQLMEGERKAPKKPSKDW